MLRAWGVFLEPASDVFDGRQWAEDVNLLVRRVNVNLQFPAVCANANVLVVIVNLNEFRVGIFFQLFDDGMEDGQNFVRILGGVAQLLAGNEMHGHGNGRGGNPHMNVGSAGVVFVNIDADDALAHGISAREDERAAKCESCFC